MDDIEKYIKDNHHRLDNKKAPADLWSKIEADLNTPVRNSNYKKWVGGFILLAISCLIGLYAWSSANSDTSIQEESTTPMLYAELESFAETEQYYLSAIYASHQELDKIHKDETLDEDLKALDKIDLELRREYKNAQGMYREQVLRALIQNHQTKLNLMLDVLDILNEQNKIDENVF